MDVVAMADKKITNSASLPKAGTTDNAATQAEHWNTNDPTDGKTRWEFKSRYPFWTRIQIFSEAIYLTLLLFVGLCLLFWIYHGAIALPCTPIHFNELNDHLKRMISFPIAGLIGGAMFGLKYLYRVAARGWWHEDRRIWRLLSPWLSATLATMVGILIDGGMLGMSYSQSNAGNPYSTLLGIAFITGYFADSALAKLQDVANVVFASSSRDESK
jgi:hypothetical protein